MTNQRATGVASVSKDRSDFQSHTASRIGLLTLATINVTTVVSLGGLPSEAKYGLAAVFYYLFAAIFFLIPVALVSAELTTAWPQEGGVFRWVSEAFGDLWGLIAVCSLWMSFTILFPSCLIYGATALAFTGSDILWDKALAANKHYVITIVLSLYWLATFITLRGSEYAAKVASWGGLIGTIAPASLLIIFGIFYYLSGRPMYVDIAWKDFFPDFTNTHNLVLAAGIFLCYAGIELNSVHVTEIANPARSFPIAISLASLVTVAIYALGTLTIAFVIQPGQIDLTQSLLVTYRDFFKLFDIPILEPVINIALAIGAFSATILWLSGPSRALMIAGEAGYLPLFMQKLNPRNIPSRIIILQGMIVTLLSTVFTLMPSVEATFQLFNQLVTILYLLMYLLMFAAAIRLKYTQSNTNRPFVVPGGIIGMWITAGCGMLASFIAFIISFMPPSQIDVGNQLNYSLTLLSSFLIAAAFPIALYYFAKPEWKETSKIGSSGS